MTPREAILGRVKAALAGLPERAGRPEVPSAVLRSRAAPDAGAAREALWALFARQLAAVNGTPLGSPAALAPWLLSGGWTHGYVAPELVGLFPELSLPPFQVETSFDRGRIDDYAFGITRAAAAIAETGTLVLEDRSTPSRLAALAPWVHVAVVGLEDVVPDVATAVGRLGDDPAIVWVTGPSKTADVEGILIEGVHGPGRQVAVLA